MVPSYRREKNKGQPIAAPYVFRGTNYARAPIVPPCIHSAGLFG